MCGQNLALANVGVWSYCDMMNICRREDGFSIDSESSRVLFTIEAMKCHYYFIDLRDKVFLGWDRILLHAAVLDIYYCC